MTARFAALEALGRCRRDGAWTGAAIDSAIRKHGLDSRDAAFASSICLGVMQWRDFCDYYIGLYCTKRPEKLEPKILDILRIGAYQLLFMDRVPKRAAVNETVALCDISGVARAKGIVNAVLRRISENSEKLPEIPGKGTAEYLSIRYSHPVWLAEKIISEKGYDFAEGFFSADNTQPSLDIHVNTLKISCDEYLKKLDELQIEYSTPLYPINCVQLKGGDVKSIPGFDEGLFYVQDRSAHMVSEISDVFPGTRVLDVCAAPGGKSFSCAIKMGGRGEIISCDIHEKKLSLIKSGAERLGIDIISAQCADGRETKQEWISSFDTVICDVPCSGFGVIVKKPEIRQKSEEDAAALPAIQSAILNNASQYVKHGGTLIYSTCTVFYEENEDVVFDFLNTHAEFSLEAFDIGEKHIENGMYTFWPNVDGTDGFFAAKLIRKF